MNRDIFSRPFRMTHKFGDLEAQADPLQQRTFEPKFPVRPDQLRSSPITRETHGELRNNWSKPKSTISKPNGSLADFGGYDNDNAQRIASPIPASTVKRVIGGTK
jgi:hypothetical protein